jgi:hypothetical protein
MRKIHVIGCGPRSGTTLLTEMMVACFRIDLHPEHEERVYAWPRRRAAVYLAKAPRDMLIIERYLRWMRNLNVLCLMRDPRDVVVSRHRMDPERYWASLRYWKTYLPRWRRLSGMPRFLTVRYEDLVREPDEVQDRIAANLPFLEPTARFSEFHARAEPGAKAVQALGSVRPVTAQSIGNWRNHLPRLAGQLQQHGSISDDLFEFGYEPDRSWEGELEGVEPDLTPGHWPEHFTPEDLAARLRHRGPLAVAKTMLGHSALLNALRRFTFRPRGGM